MEWHDFNLNDKLTTRLESLFEKPTEIQEKVLVYASGKVDLLIQAKTGEGKTLCYAVPIINYIFNFYSRSEDMIKKISPVALILVPTRELVKQVKEHIEKLIKDENTGKNLFDIKICEILGGLTPLKQTRILNKNKPEIIIGTPGRLWDIIENEASDLLDKLNNLKFLVIDEADRMYETGHFKELKNIISHVYSRVEVKKSNEEDAQEKVDKYVKIDDSEMDKEENEKLAKSLNVNIDNIETIDPIALMNKGAKFDQDIDLDENQEMEEEEDGEELEEENEGEEFEEGENEGEEIEDEEEENEIGDIDEDRKAENIKEEKEAIKNLRALKKEQKKEKAEPKIDFATKVGLRTILCSATIDKVHKGAPSKKEKKKGKNQEKESEEDTHFQKLIKNLKFYNKLIYLKLKTDPLSELEENKENEVSMLPSKLELDCYKCTSTTKDYFLYYLLRENLGSKVIIFTNSISHTKKLFSIFSYFSEFKCTCLHSKMLQSARVKNLERFTNNQTPILFCTDIGARGLDIPYVDLVIHYHIPQKTETFIHRSGRTARANRKGKVSSLISEKELSLYKKIMIDLHYKQFSMKSLNVNQLEKIKSLFEYAKEIEKESFSLKKANKEKQWYRKTAEQCEMLYSDDEREEEDKERQVQEKLLNKKRKLLSKDRFNKKKIYTKLNESMLKRSSFLTPEMVSKLNSLMKEESFHKGNITQMIRDAKLDARSIKPKDKPKKRRYMHRRKGK